MPVTTEELLEYLGIDYTDDMVTRNIERAIKSADAYLKGSIGDEYPVEDPRAKELALIVAADLYENRGIKDPVATNSSSISGNVRKLVTDMSLQLKLELRRRSNG